MQGFLQDRCMMYMSRFYGGIFLPWPVIELLVRVCGTGQKYTKFLGAYW